MATLTKGQTFLANDTVTAAKLHALVDNATLSAVVNADIDDSAAIVDTKLATIATAGKVSATAFVDLASTPAGAGVIPSANLPAAITDYVKNDGTVNPTNLLYNGDFEAWSAGASAAPDGWALTGAGTSVAREASVIKLGTYSSKITCAIGANAVLSKSVHADNGIVYWKGRYVTLSVWVYCGTANVAKVAVFDAATRTYSSIHTGNSTWQLLTVTHPVSSSATELTVELYSVTPGSAVSAYFDGAMLVEGASAFAFSPKPAEEGVWADYSAVSTIVGWVSFTTKSINVTKIGKTVFFNAAISGTSNATTATFTLPYTSANTTAYHAGSVFGVQDNSSNITTAAHWENGPNSNIITLGKDSYNTTWTNANVKQIFCSGHYQAA